MNPILENILCKALLEQLPPSLRSQVEIVAGVLREQVKESLAAEIAVILVCQEILSERERQTEQKELLGIMPKTVQADSCIR